MGPAMSTSLSYLYSLLQGAVSFARPRVVLDSHLQSLTPGHRTAADCDVNTLSPRHHRAPSHCQPPGRRTSGNFGQERPPERLLKRPRSPGSRFPRAPQPRSGMNRSFSNTSCAARDAYMIKYHRLDRV